MQMSHVGACATCRSSKTPPRRAASPVEVHVGEWDRGRGVAPPSAYELARGGQVYYVCNRVQAPSTRRSTRVHARSTGRRAVGVAHGQDDPKRGAGAGDGASSLTGELDVLVATTIIESGIDNPHTNTLIIEDAQRLGLAQMYQLKGRVGRSSSRRPTPTSCSRENVPFDRRGRRAAYRHQRASRIWAAA